MVAAWRLGYSDASGLSGQSGNFQIILFPGTSQNWKYDNLQD